MVGGWLRSFAVLVLLVLAGAPAGAGGPTEQCAVVGVSEGGGTYATTSTYDGIGVQAGAGGIRADGKFLNEDCVGDTTSKSSEMAYDAFERVLERVEGALP